MTRHWTGNPVRVPEEHRSDPSYLRRKSRPFRSNLKGNGPDFPEQEGLLSCIHMHPPMFDPHTSADCTVGSRSSDTAYPRVV